ncbi:MAG TPA: hypothetical protein DIV79_01840 [Opitutae bacterium]|nr:hypothetical protein [Opitutaceae bacterium]HCR28744.1 hypothetical protein [Opitutae bacterium]
MSVIERVYSDLIFLGLIPEVCRRPRSVGGFGFLVGRPGSVLRIGVSEDRDDPPYFQKYHAACNGDLFPFWVQSSETCFVA